MCAHTHTHTGSEREGHEERETGRNRDRHIETKTDRYRDTERGRETETRERERQREGNIKTILTEQLFSASPALKVALKARRSYKESSRSGTVDQRLTSRSKK